MKIPYTRYQYPDHEVKAMVDIIHRHEAAMDNDDRTRMAAALDVRRSAFEAGVAKYGHKHYLNIALRELDPLLRLRWDFETACPAVDRLDPFEKCWRPVLHWRAALNYNLIEYLKSCDTWVRSPAANRRMRQERADAKRRAIDQAHTDRVLGAIDNMSRTQIERFIQVEEAIATGEPICLHGDDLQQAERHHQRVQNLRRELYESGHTVQEFVRRDQVAAVNPWAPYRAKSAASLERRLS